MWIWSVVLFTSASAQEPAAKEVTGAIQIEVSSGDTWAMAAWHRAVSRIERQWRRATRRSEEPVPEPELPKPGWRLSGVTVELAPMGEAPSRTCVTADEGICLFEELPPGFWYVTTTKDGYRPVLIQQIQVTADVIYRQSISLEDAEDIIVTSVGRDAHSTPPG